VRTVIREHRDSPAEGILQAILDAIGSFRQSAPQGDDITLVVVRIED
jgi:serine phosphatase RsbU (regulator of sigma subunit)